MTGGDIRRLYWAAALEAEQSTDALLWMLAADAVLMKTRARVFRDKPELASAEDRGASEVACQRAGQALGLLTDRLCSFYLQAAMFDRDGEG